MGMKNRYLKKKALPRNHQWQWDFDYVERLSAKEKEFLNQFVAEYYDASFKEDKPLHKGTRLRRECYRRKNRQNKDVQSILDCGGRMDRVDKKEKA